MAAAAAKDIVLITGANKGLGFESAKQLAQRGFKVLLAARDEALGKAAVAKLEGLDVEFLQLDVTNQASITAAAEAVAAKYGRVDVLVNNAGVMFESHASDVKNVDLDAARRTFEVNVIGVIAVTNAFLPLVLKAQAVPRIVVLSSILGSHAEHADKASMIYGATGLVSYNASKAAINMYVQNLAHALADTGAKVNSAHPGWVKTDMGGEAAPLTIDQGVETTVYLSTLDKDGPTGGFFFGRNPVRW